MRVSIREDDPGYANFRGYGRHRVLLNGSEVGDVVTADEEQGLIVRNARDEHGELIIDRERREVARETVRGVVKVETNLKPRA